MRSNPINSHDADARCRADDDLDLVQRRTRSGLHRHEQASGAASAAPAHADLARLMPVFERLVDETAAQVIACPAKPDPTFAGFEELLAATRSATTLEGTLLERGIKAICKCRDELVVVPLDAPLPVLLEAKAFLKRNDWAKASALRLASEVHTKEYYRPDLLLVDAIQHRALILDIKRSVTSHKPNVLADLRTRMMAAALVARDWLERECDAPAVERVEIAIIDGSGEPADHERAIFSMSDLDALLGIEGAGEAIVALRRLYGQRIRDILLPRCRKIAGVSAEDTDASNDASPARRSVRPDNAVDEDASADGHVPSARADIRDLAMPLSCDRRVSVGIASVGGRA
ncbi:MAG: hypothetical protein MEQ84_02630 [Mesorhizobium sp.]|nr:hypothetical protein [Mesorhizobium sp.]